MSDRLTFLAVFLLLICTFSCNRFDNVKIVDDDAEFAIPLIDTEIVIDSVLNQLSEETFITLGPDELITLNYKGEFLEVNAQTVFDIFGQFGAFPLEENVTIAPLDPPNSIRIDLVSFKPGTIAFVFDSFHEEDMQITFTLPDLKKDGVAFSKNLSVTYDGTVPIDNAGLWGIQGYELVADDNELRIEYEALHADGTPDTLSNVFMAIAGFEFDYVEGYLGTDLYEMDRDTIEIDFFDNWIDGSVYFENPKIRLTANNAFGFPLNSQTNFFDVFTVNNEVLTLESEFVDNGIYIDYPTLNEVGEVKTTVFEFTKENSNIDEILGEGPVAVDYEFDAVPNPASNTDIIGFMDCNSFFNVQVEVELPLHATVDGFQIFDTIMTDPIKFDNSFLWYDDIEYVEFKLITINRMGFDIPLQISFADDDGVVLETLLSDPDNFLIGGEVDLEGTVIASASSEQIVRFETDQIENIKSATQVIIDATFSSVNNSEVSVRVNSGQGIQIRMGAKVGFGN